ncbi:hypothetical protein RIF29_09962 [Crotalaria pallida]|uniref:inorganic diphosphatase n=1 Tax=Crotalaria pallida TaxID=3830 RepID=A0AAN9IJV3_CROPI
MILLMAFCDYIGNCIKILTLLSVDVVDVVHLNSQDSLLEEKVLSLEDENHVLRQIALSAPPKSNRSGVAKSFSEAISCLDWCDCMRCETGVKQIGERQRKIGEVLRVKPLAALAMIDEGELDRKIVAILLNDPKASLVNDVDDVEKHVHIPPHHYVIFFFFFNNWQKLLPNPFTSSTSLIFATTTLHETINRINGCHSRRPLVATEGLLTSSRKTPTNDQDHNFSWKISSTTEDQGVPQQGSEGNQFKPVFDVEVNVSTEAP